MALDLAFPALLPVELVRELPALWMACAACALAAGAVESVWRRREARLLAAVDARISRIGKKLPDATTEDVP